MATITVTANQVAPTNETEYVRRTYKAAAAITAGDVCIWDSNGKVTPTGGTAPIAGARVAGIALRNAGIGDMVTLLQEGCVAGFDVSALTLESAVSAGINGILDTAAAVKIGMVISFNGGADKMVWIDVRPTWLAVAA